MVKAKDVRKAILDVSFEDALGHSRHQWAARIAGDPAKPPVNHEWTEYSGTVTIPAGTKTVSIGLQMYGPGQVWFDRVTAAYGR